MSKPYPIPDDGVPGQQSGKHLTPVQASVLRAWRNDFKRAEGIKLGQRARMRQRGQAPVNP